MNKQKIIFFRESFAQSFLADVSTFGFLAASFWFNHEFSGGSPFYDALIALMFIVFTAQKIYSKDKVFYDEEELVEYLNAVNSAHFCRKCRDLDVPVCDHRPWTKSNTTYSERKK